MAFAFENEGEEEEEEQSFLEILVEDDAAFVAFVELKLEEGFVVASVDEGAFVLGIAVVVETDVVTEAVVHDFDDPVVLAVAVAFDLQGSFAVEPGHLVVVVVVVVEESVAAVVTVVVHEVLIDCEYFVIVH